MANELDNPPNNVNLLNGKYTDIGENRPKNKNVQQEL